MAARKKKSKADLAGNADPRSPLDGAALLAAAKPLLTELSADLLKRADESAPVTEALKARHAAERTAERTAEAYPEWRRTFVEQVAAAWLLSCVFVRTLEDRGLLGKARIAGEGAEDSWKAFLQLAPSLSEREYLLTVFRELSRLPATGALFDARHNPVWLLGPSAEGARKLLDLFRSPSVEAPTFRFGGEDTRFLGDLYQDVSEGVRKQYALLQTPRFVEAFILDRTLDPAIEKFGLDETNLIDPTCGSGHFLLGAFDRLYEARLRAAPGLTAREAATKALDAVAGADINPYAVAIARFRLTLAFVEKCGFKKLRDAPAVPVHVAVADSLLYNPHVPELAMAKGADPAAWAGAHFALEDPEAAKAVLFKQYAAVVGNPPYITVKDAVLRERYREAYASAFRSYSLAVPFTERFFQLGRDGAFVGMITANSFMKREFGKLLIEKYLPSVNLELIVNTSGAYIPGHGTPTVLLFGTQEKPKGTDVLAVLASRGEPSTPEDPEKGLVWSSIAEHWNEVGFENEYISVAKVERKGLEKHPWSLGGGGAGELKERLEERAERKLGDVVELPIGRAARVGADEVYMVPAQVAQRLGSPVCWRDLLIGEAVRDWGVGALDKMLFPYDPERGLAVREEEEPALAPALRYLWPFRTVLDRRVTFQGSMGDAGLKWYEYMQYTPSANRTALSITFAFVATHNHFVLDRGGKVFNRSAPIIKLPETATEDDHLALLTYLNSSTACFWMKQVMMNKGGSGIGRGVQDEAWEARFEFDGTKIGSVPLPPGWQGLAPLGKLMLELAAEHEAVMPPAWFQKWADDHRWRQVLTDFGTPPRDTLQRMVAIQEEIDWEVYSLFGLLGPSVRPEQVELRDSLFEEWDRVDTRSGSPFPAEIAPGHRAFEQSLDPNVTQWFARNGYEAPRGPDIYGDPTAALLRVRMAAVAADPALGLIERAEYKRRWIVRDVEQEAVGAASAWALDRLEALSQEPHAVKASALALTWLSKDVERAGTVLERYLGRDGLSWVRSALVEEAVPYLAALRYTDTGLEIHAEWQSTWDLQRREDRGEKVDITPPPKYGREDYASPTFWSLRGKLDVPKERFISYPGCESDEDKEPVYGWAGWDHLRRAVALAGLYQDRKQREGWPKDRLLPILAGLLELLPWLHQWHNTPSADLGGERPSDQFQAFLDAECAEHGFTHDDLRAWRPPTAAERRKAKANAKAKKHRKAKDEQDDDA